MRCVCLERKRFTRFLFGLPVWFALVYCALVVRSTCALAQAVLPTTLYHVGMPQGECFARADGGRPLTYMLIYPPAPDSAAVPLAVILSTNLHLHTDATMVPDGLE